MRVLHVLEPAAGGVARHVRDLAGEQVRRGHEVRAVVSCHGPLASDLRRLGVRVVALDLRPEISDGARDLRTLRTLVALVRRHRPDVLHSHGNKGGVLGRTVARALAVPAVHTPHSFAYVSQELRSRRGQRLRRALTLGLERALAPWAEAVLCVSAQERSQALADGIGDADRLVVVPNGIADPAPASPDPRLLAWRGGGPLVGCLVRLAPEKGPDLFLDAVERLRARGTPVRAALVGDGPMAPALEARRSGDVLLAPFPGRPEPVLAAFDLAVFPSRWESLPIGVLEAMAAGLPVVAADAGGMREAVLDGRTGVVVPVGDPPALAEAIARLAGDEGLRRRLGAAGRDHQRARFSLSAMCDGVEAAYARACR